MSRKNIFSTAVVILMLTVLITSVLGCSSTQKTEESTFYLYYLSQSGNELYPVEGVIDLSNDTEVLIDSIWTHLSEVTESGNYVSPIPSEIELNKTTVENGHLIFDFTSAYYELSAVREILFRAALVKTFVQIDEVSAVEIRIDDQPYTLADGTAVGPMNDSDFLDVFSDNMNAYTKTKVTLYYSNEEGDMLIPVSRDVVFSNTKSVYEYVLECLIEGPDGEEGCYSAIPKETQLLSINVEDGLCVVNFNNEFLDGSIEVLPEVTIYSIVDSLTETSGITEVQIMVNGSAGVTYLDKINLSLPIQRNLDYVKSIEEGGEED